MSTLTPERPPSRLAALLGAGATSSLLVPAVLLVLACLEFATVRAALERFAPDGVSRRYTPAVH
jgi:hypothetical protein